MRRNTVVGRRGPGLVGTMARTAVVAGTATAVTKGVSSSMDQKAAQQQQAAYSAGMQQAQMQAQQEALAQQQQQLLAAQAATAQPPSTPAASPGSSNDDTIAQLQKLSEMQKAGILTPEEFTQLKARLLGS